MRLFWKMYFSIMISLVTVLSCFVVFISLKGVIGDKWSAWLGLLLKEASEKGAETVLPIMLFFVAAIVILGIILYFSIKYFKKPIRELINGADKIAGGDLTHRAPIHLEDEMGLLARAFNSMAEDLEKTTASKLYMNNILDTMIDALIVVGPDMRIILMNKAASDLLDYGETELLGNTIGTIFGSGQGDFVESARLTRLIEKGGARNHETVVETRGGRRMPVLVNCSAMKDKDGKIDCFVCTIRDVTARKVAEDASNEERQRFKTLTENAPIGMALIDKRGSCTYINPKFREIFGYGIDDISTEQRWFGMAFPDPKYRYSVIKAWEEDLDEATPGGKFSRTLTVTCKDGTEKIIHAITVTLGGGERLIAYEDITERNKSRRGAEKCGRKIQKNL